WMKQCGPGPFWLSFRISSPPKSKFLLFSALSCSLQKSSRANKIDVLLQQCGWFIQNRSTINLSAGRGIAVREALLKGGDEVDYLLFVDGKAIGTVKAKP